MAGFETAIQLLEDVFFSSTFAGQSWIMMLIILVGSMVIITRNWQDWGVLTLPVMTGWKYCGMPVPLVFFLVSTIMFVLSILSTKVISGSLNTIGERWKEAKERRKSSEMSKVKYEREEKRINIQEQMEQLKLADLVENMRRKREMEERTK